MVSKALFSSVKDDWETPDEIYAELDREFGFSLDVCAFDWNAKSPAWLTIFDDALSLDWTWVCRDVLDQPPVMWMNPPYGRQIGNWIRKAYETSTMGGTVVCLIPSRTDTVWWHKYVMKSEIRFLKGRIRFKNAPHGAPFPSAISVFKPISMHVYSGNNQSNYEHQIHGQGL